MGLAPLASYFSFYSKRKVTKRMPPRYLRPKKQGAHLGGGVIMLHQNSQKTLRQLAQKAHDNATA
ncbi:MAG: hypothetical protein GQ550_05015 [Gammaproteobacteria bacterium]|nr:hypothetical protein [Gammaproteobacteria bacterium]